MKLAFFDWEHGGEDYRDYYYISGPLPCIKAPQFDPPLLLHHPGKYQCNEEKQITSTIGMKTV